MKLKNISGKDLFVKHNGEFVNFAVDEVKELPNRYALHQYLEPVKQVKKELDLNNDGKIDKKDSKIASKVMNEIKKQNKKKKSKKKAKK